MATARNPLTPATNRRPAVVSIPTAEPSGPHWVARFPTGTAVSDCIEPFRSNLDLFLSALETAGAHVTISATFRPAERAYLMHWSWSIVKRGASPQAIPGMAGVNIRWDHEDEHGVYSAMASMNAAQAMVDGYAIRNLRTPPSLNSKHTQRLAVDMSISWSGNLVIDKADGTSRTISTRPRSGMNAELHDVGASYGVVKYVGGDDDRPHWSDDGH